MRLVHPFKGVRLIFSSIKKEARRIGAAKPANPRVRQLRLLSVACERGGAIRDGIQLAFPAQPDGLIFSSIKTDLAGFAIFFRLSKRARAREGVADFLAPWVFFGGFDLDLVPWLEKKITDSLRSSASL